MRLIDADELKVNCVCLNAFCVDGRTIENAPTVNAIPIEWIEERLKRAIAFRHSKAEGKVIVNECVVEVVSASFTANVLFNLLVAWEKENGRSK